MPSPLKIADAADLVDKSINNVWLKETPTMETFFDKMYHVTKGVTDLYTKDSSISGYGNPGRVIEQGVIAAEAPVQGFDQTYEQIMYGDIGGFSYKMWKFGIKKRDLTRVVSGLKKAMMVYREELLARKYDAAFLTSYTQSDPQGSYSVTTTGGDGRAMADATHTREDGGTAWSNIVSDGTTVNMNFDYPALKACRRIGALVKTPKGKPFVQDYNRFMVSKGSSAEMRGLEMQGAIKAGKIPGEFSNDGSAAKMFEMIANPFMYGTGNASSTTSLSAATNFHGVDTNNLSEEYGPQYFESEDITLDEQNIVYKTKEIQYSVHALFAYGHNDPRCTIHSTGANV